jgi:pSer/pThr/pTyr-binding forkhead associated (FHA) protein
MESKEESPVLIGQSGPVQGKRWTIPPVGITLGRENDCEVPIPDRQVSRRHAKIDRRAGKTYISDLASKNGTWVNGVPVKDEVEIKDGDLIQIALAADFMYVASDSTMPLESEGAVPRQSRIRLNPVEHSVSVNDRLIDPPLSIHQYRFLEMLVLRSGGLVTREDVIGTVWPGEDTEGITDQAIDALVRRLRDRLKEVDPDREYILTIRGHGFRLDTSA